MTVVPPLLRARARVCVCVCARARRRLGKTESHSLFDRPSGWRWWWRRRRRGSGGDRMPAPEGRRETNSRKKRQCARRVRGLSARGATAARGLTKHSSRRFREADAERAKSDSHRIGTFSFVSPPLACAHVARAAVSDVGDPVWSAQPRVRAASVIGAWRYGSAAMQTSAG